VPLRAEDGRSRRKLSVLKSCDAAFCLRMDDPPGPGDGVVPLEPVAVSEA
jgi:hypothetical protein